MSGIAGTSKKRIQKEISELSKESLGDITLGPSDHNLYIWHGSLPGPEGSPYEGGVYEIEIQLGTDYPFSAPRAVFKTRIYHMNISEQGGICIDILKNNWSPALSLFKVMLSLSSLLTDPNPKDPLVPNIASQYISNRKLHDQTARQWTSLYAKPKPKPQPASMSKGKSKAKAETTITIDDTPIQILDSDEEDGAGAPKRKRKASAEPTTSSRASKTRSRPATRSNAGGTRRATPTVVDDEVIVIEDD
ncbi:hypothetical protein CYLTODRAFT_393710 [Cylindrobasidium torrendii FP15055 ss-10]|uniref:E2 ubiquitin-conjugating enzyme n=1 Tax=Cylindrobasidium torrendii FP15055 ss-10 TaxID=1314674 RepID=A0A0D7BFU8_9AGAR|nr:hypothetical protein CYLTODRAFT_393710 [Cylindrobasidium torrendii FP15055 ss-10]